MPTKLKPGAKYNAPMRLEHISGRPYSKDELRAMLPQVGERRTEIMTSDNTAQIDAPTAQRCTVVEVSEEHLWYRVVFDGTGISQCYKLPQTNWTGPRVGWM